MRLEARNRSWCLAAGERWGRQVNCGRAGVPYMEENRKEAVTFLLQTYGGARRGRKGGTFSLCLPPKVDQ